MKKAANSAIMKELPNIVQQRPTNIAGRLHADSGTPQSKISKSGTAIKSQVR